MNNKNEEVQNPVVDALDTQIEAWKAKYKDVYQLSVDLDDDEEKTSDVIDSLTALRIICREPGRNELSRFIKDVVGGGNAIKAQNNFFYGCLLHPTAEVLQKIVEQKPGLIVALGNKLQELTGMNQNFTLKKL